MNHILIAGGAGYIGSHVVRQLTRRKMDVTVIDNLSTGFSWAVPEEHLIIGDIGERALVRDLVRSRKIDTVMHFAAHIVVPESVSNPYRYYENNVVRTIELLKGMIEGGAGQFIFSSTAAVYGNPETIPIPEEETVKPINPYGNTKAVVERILDDFSAPYGIRFVSLRYFNAAGADEGRGIGERHNPETHLIPLLLKTAKGELPEGKIFGTDYPTPDGTCIRDYIHVNDLAEAHILALHHLDQGGESCRYNCGYGKGYSVREVVEAVKKITGIDFPVREEERRPGDPPILVADSRKIKEDLAWRPKYDDLEYIVKTAWEWEKQV